MIVRTSRVYGGTCQWEPARHIRKTLAKAKEMPTRKDAIAGVLGAVLGPGSAIAGALAGPGSQLASLVKAIEEKAEKGEAAAPATAG